MNQAQLTSIIRQIMLSLGGGLVTKGYIDTGTLEALVGAFLVIGGAVWALYTRRAAGITADAAAQPGVRRIVADPKLADAVTSSKVVAPGG